MRCCGWSWNCSGRNLHSRHRKLQLRLRLLLGLVSFLAELKLVLTVISPSLCCWFCKCLEWIADMPTYNILNYDNQRCLMFFPLRLGYIFRWSRSVAHCTRVSVCVCRSLIMGLPSCPMFKLAQFTPWNVLECCALLGMVSRFPGTRIVILKGLCRKQSIAWEAMGDKLCLGGISKRQLSN